MSDHRITEMKIEQWPVDKPIPYARNAREIPQSAIDKVAVSIDEFGWRQPIVVDQVRTFSDCEVRWFYEHLLGLPDPPTATMALDNAIRTALMTNVRYRFASKADIQTEGVVGLFRRAWKQQLASASFCEDEVPEALGRTGAALVRIYMHEAAPWPRPVLGSCSALSGREIFDAGFIFVDAGAVGCRVRAFSR